MSEPSDARDVLLNRLADEFADRQRAGERPRLEEYCARHPELAEDIRELFPALVELERAKADAGPELAVAVADAPPVTNLGDFRLLREVGRGGMGVVFEAEQVSLGRRVAIKLLPAAVFRDPAKRRRFEREAKAAARLHHTNIVPVHGFGEHDGTPYYVMQLIPGLGLDAVVDELGRSPAGGRTPEPNRPRAEPRSALSVELARTLLGEGRPGAAAREGEADDAPPATATLGATPDPTPTSPPDRGSSVSPGASSVHLPGQSGSGVEGPTRRRATYWESVARIGVQVAGALAYAHRLGVLHRDIKPSNLLLDLDGVVWVADFGLAKADDSDDLTRTGDLLGTLRYMPPEAFEGKSDARGDVYSLGLTLFELVALRPAYEEGDRNRLIRQVTTGDPPRLRKLRADAPRDLVTVVEKAIDRDPARRYQTAAALAEDLQRFLDGRPIAARRATELERLWKWARRRPAVAGLVAALALCLLAGSVVSTVFAVRADRSARDAALREKDATAARDAARRNADEARQQKAEAEAARLEALDQAYLATRNEVRAMRLARPRGWRAAALDRLRGLARLGSRNLDRVDLRSEALACLTGMDVRLLSGFITRDIGAWHVRYSPDGRTLAVNDDKTNRVYLRDLASDRELPPIPKSTGFAPFAFHPGGALAMPASAGRVAYHPLRPGQPTFPEIVGDGDALNLAFNRSGDRLAIVWGDADHKGQGGATRLRRVAVYATETGTPLWSADLPANTPGGYKVPLALSPDGQSLATSGPDREVRLFSVGKDEGPVVLGKVDVRLCAIAFHPGGDSLAAGGFLTGAVWDLGSRSERFRVHAPEGGFWDVAYSPDGQLLAGACNDRTVRLWDARSGRELAAVPAETGGVCLSVAFSPEGDRLAAGGHSAAVFAIEGRRECRSETSATNHLSGIAFDRALPALHSCGGDECIRTWDLNDSSARVLRRTGRIENPTVVRLAPDGRHLAIGFGRWVDGRGEDFSVGIYRLDDSGAERRLKGPKESAFDLALDPSGTCLAAACKGGGLYLWEFETGVLQHRIQLAGLRAVRFLDEIHILAAAGNRLVLLAAADGTVRRELTFPAAVTAFVINPDRRVTLVGTSDATVHRVRLPDLAVERSRAVVDHRSDLLIAAPPDGRVLAVTATAGPSNLLVDPRTLEPVARLPETNRSVFCLAFDGTGRYFALGGSQITLWDLALVRDELAPLGLDWDRPAASVAPAGDLAPGVGLAEPRGPAITTRDAHLAEIEKARGLVQSGVAAFQRGQYAAAVADLQRASERFRGIRRARPDDPMPARLHGISLGFLAGSLRDSKRPAEALARFRESLAVYESLRSPDPGDLYNMACACAMASALDDRGSPDDREALRVRAVGHLRRAIEGDGAQFLPQVAADRDLDTLRGRADFRGLMADASFPRDPFARPSPLPRPEAPPGPKVPEAEGGKSLVARKDEGHALLAAGRAREGLSVLASVLAGGPEDTLLLLEVAALQAWFGQDAELALTCRWALESARDTRDPIRADRTAKVCCLRPSDDKARLDATLALARQAVGLGKESWHLPNFRMALGMAEYRSGNDEAAEAAFLAAVNSGRADLRVSGTSTFYRAMSLFRRGKEAEARRLATEAASRMRPLPADENNPLAGGANADDLILWLAYREARAMIGFDAAPAAPAQSSLKPAKP